MRAIMAENGEANEALLTRRFEQHYGDIPRIFRAPGRVNLIGEHTDYNDGFVMPVAIEFESRVAVGPGYENALRIYSSHYDEEVILQLDSLAGPPRSHWSDYVRGVAAMLQTAGYTLRGANLLIESNVPIGSGLSSSAALEVSTALALAAAAEIELPRLQVARLCQLAEQRYTGTQCGIMDQFISVFGRVGDALLLDCRSLEYSYLPLPKDVRMAICHSGVERELAKGEYNLRRFDCEAGVTFLQKCLPRITALRDVTVDELEHYRRQLPGTVYRRCRHVTSENQRVQEAATALAAGDTTGFGMLMYLSHASLRDDYEVSCKELDLLVDAAREVDGVYGARMMGGGFGGCTINLVAADATDQFQKKVAERYRAHTGRIPEIYLCSAAEGAGEVL